MILPDTNILIDYFRDKQPVKLFIETQDKENLAICSIVAMELYRGSLNKAEFKYIKNTERFFNV